jgi:hypothetical protein
LPADRQTLIRADAPALQKHHRPQQPTCTQQSTKIVDCATEQQRTVNALVQSTPSQATAMCRHSCFRPGHHQYRQASTQLSYRIQSSIGSRRCPSSTRTCSIRPHCAATWSW